MKHTRGVSLLTYLCCAAIASPLIAQQKDNEITDPLELDDGIVDRQP